MAGNLASTRPDERSVSQLRPIVCTRGLLNRANGSARWSNENTIVVAAVYGPKSVSGKKENPERATLEVIWKPKSGVAGNAEKEAEHVVRRTFESIILSSVYPNTGISIIVQVVNDDGSLLACALNAVCAALVDAGIPLSGLIASVAVAVTASREVLLDPTKLEEQKVSAHVCFGFPSRPAFSVKGPGDTGEEPLEHGVLTCVTRGALSVDDYLTCLERARAASAKISEFSRTSLEQCQLTQSGLAAKLGISINPCCLPSPTNSSSGCFLVAKLAPQTYHMAGVPIREHSLYLANMRHQRVIQKEVIASGSAIISWTENVFLEHANPIMFWKAQTK